MSRKAVKDTNVDNPVWAPRVATASPKPTSSLGRARCTLELGDDELREARVGSTAWIRSVYRRAYTATPPAAVITAAGMTKRADACAAGAGPAAWGGPTP